MKIYFYILSWLWFINVKIDLEAKERTQERKKEKREI